jgi:hypothetical protein
MYIQEAHRLGRGFSQVFLRSYIVEAGEAAKRYCPGNYIAEDFEND